MALRTVTSIKPEFARLINEAIGPVQLRIRALDQHGETVFDNDGDAAAVIADAVEFLILHGTDPDEYGQDAHSGSIEFEVVED